MGNECQVSVIVPVYNDPEGVETTIKSLTNQTFPSENFEIVVVDNNSSDRTKDVACELLADINHGYVLDERDIQSSYAARNTGIEFSSGDLIAFLDADMSAPKTWLEELLTEFERANAEYIGCDVNLYCPLPEDTVMSNYSIAFGFPVEFYLKHQNFAPTCCLAVKRSVIDDVGGFDAGLTSSGDWEFGQRVAQAGYDQHFASDIELYHPTRPHLRGYIKKRLRVGAGQEQLYRRHGTRSDGRPWYHPKNLLPPHPGNFKRRLSSDVDKQTLILFYLIACFGKLMLFCGRLHWILEGRQFNALKRGIERIDT